MLDENFSYTFGIVEARYRSGNPDKESRDYYRQIFKPNETLTCTVCCILDDAKANAENLYFFPTLLHGENSKGYELN
ncbi:MAG: hypothetical protein PHV07_08025 [Oscillospiraceae bacterium]|nr:hypothetical protein [Oscillospiraceae bacterium]